MRSLYRVKDWGLLYENNRTRELKTLSWVPIPNRHDGDGYTLLVERPNGASLFGAWVAVLQVASRCDPRGTLMRDKGMPHDAASLSRMTRIREAIIAEMLQVCTEENHWLEIVPPQEGATIPQEGATIPQEGAPKEANERTNGREWKEGNEIANRAVRLCDRMKLCREVLGDAEITARHKRWLKRAEDFPKRFDVVLAETKAALQEGRIKTTPAQYAEDLWKRESSRGN